MNNASAASSHLRRGRYLAFKHGVDALAASMLLFLLCPLFLATAALIRIRLGSPVLFRQQRIGKDETPFVVFKFRTMREAQDQNGNPLPDALRLTPIGKWIRSWSLDELPQLVNVVRGEMSFIGPRPLLPEYLPRYSPGHRRRHEVRPGLSGLAQVHGRNHSTWRRRLDLDVEYVERISPALDFSIALRTVCKLLVREGISQRGEATMSEFRGIENHG